MQGQSSLLLMSVLAALICRDSVEYSNLLGHMASHMVKSTSAAALYMNIAFDSNIAPDAAVFQTLLSMLRVLNIALDVAVLSV